MEDDLKERLLELVRTHPAINNKFLTRFAKGEAIKE